MKSSKELDEYGLNIFNAIQRTFRMVAVGAEAQCSMHGSPYHKQDVVYLPGMYSFFQAGIKMGGPGTPEAIASINIKKDGSGVISIGVNCTETRSEYKSLFFSAEDLKKELLVVEFFLRRNFIP